MWCNHTSQLWIQLRKSCFRRTSKKHTHTWFPNCECSLSACLIFSKLPFNSAAHLWTSGPWKQLALNIPTVRISFAVSDWNVRPVNWKWTVTSQSASTCMPHTLFIQDARPLMHFILMLNKQLQPLCMFLLKDFIFYCIIFFYLVHAAAQGNLWLNLAIRTMVHTHILWSGMISKVFYNHLNYKYILWNSKYAASGKLPPYPPSTLHQKRWQPLSRFAVGPVFNISESPLFNSCQDFAC